MALARHQRGALDEAVALYEQALAITNRNGADAKLRCMIHQNLGTVANIRGDHEEALRLYLASLAGYRSLDLDSYVAQVLINIGVIHTDLRRWRAADNAYAEAMAICVARGETALQTMVEVNRAEMWLARRDMDRARAACDAALALAEQTGNVHARSETYKHYGVLSRETGQFAEAEEYLARARQIAESHSNLLLARGGRARGG